MHLSSPPYVPLAPFNNTYGRPLWSRDLRRACGFESRWQNGCQSLASAVCCQVEVSATDRSLIQSSSTEFGVYECDMKTSKMKRPRSTRCVAP